MQDAGCEPPRSMYPGDRLQTWSGDEVAMEHEKIVVVEDDIDTLEMMDLFLADEGYQPIMCSEAADAIEIVRRTQPDVVILDLMQGGPVGGWDILMEIRADPATGGIPVILYSAHVDFLAQRQGMLRTHRCLILKKPFLLPDLVATIEAALALAPAA
jgi:DNA-binding response OmpR family regulator